MPPALTTAVPVLRRGGSLNITVSSEALGLDPIVGIGAGAAGGAELLALYDSIVRWNPDARTYEMRTAAALTSNATSTEWTLRLKPNIAFRDGTPYDAEAVRYNIDRMMSVRNAGSSRAWLNYVIGTPSNVVVIDALTVRFTLSVADSAFAALLADTPGMIVSPTKLKAIGDPSAADYKAKSDAFSRHPVGAGAGPFEIVSFVNNDSIVLHKSATFYGGDPYLDEITFTPPGNPDKAVDALKSGAVKVAFLRSGVQIAAARAEPTLGGFETFVGGVGVLLANRRVITGCVGGQPEPLCKGQPNRAPSLPAITDALIRGAIAAAIDPFEFDARVNDGGGLDGNALFGQSFYFNTEAARPTASVPIGIAMLAQAKAAGATGKLRIVCTSRPDRVAVAHTLDAMLTAIGFNTSVRTEPEPAASGPTSTVVTGASVGSEGDFDVACGSLAMADDDTAVLSLVEHFWSRSPGNIVGLSEPAWDAALAAALAAPSDAAKKAAYHVLADLWTADRPGVIFENAAERIAFSFKVHGLYLSEGSLLFLDKAWVEK